MKNQLFANLTPTERLEALIENSNKQVDETIERPLTDDQIQNNKDRVAEIQTSKQEIEEKINAFVTPLKGDLKSIASETAQIIKQLRLGFIESEERLFLFFDQQSGDVDYYDSEGNFVKSRRMRPDEKQQALVFPIDGTNGGKQ